jgi:hypothetical protein
VGIKDPDLLRIAADPSRFPVLRVQFILGCDGFGNLFSTLLAGKFREKNDTQKDEHQARKKRSRLIGRTNHHQHSPS